MQYVVPNPRFVWGELVSAFEADLTQKPDLWRLSGLEKEYGGPARGDRNRENERRALIDELTGVLVQAVICELNDRLLANASGRRAGRPRDVITPYLAPKLLSIFLRCHDQAGRRSITTSVHNKLIQTEDGPLFQFIEAVIQTLNYYFTDQLHRSPLSGARLARFALEDRRRMLQELKASKAKSPATETAIAEKRQRLPLEIALQEVFAIPE